MVEDVHLLESEDKHMDSLQQFPHSAMMLQSVILLHLPLTSSSPVVS